ncbi:MAG: hypothetical protein JRF63_09275 [Deltaproteobacteria bacterium]|nr:hypothetical protein [Deltaproteobacteria bacterium]
MSRKKIRKQKKTSFPESRRTAGFNTMPLLACDDSGCGLVSFAVPAAETQLEEFCLYMDAHHLMPFDYDYDPATCAELVGESIFVAADELIDPTLRLRAIAILGHSPCIEALAVLEELASADDPLSGVVQLAFAECQGMVEMFGLSQSPMATVH